MLELVRRFQMTAYAFSLGWLASWIMSFLSSFVVGIVAIIILMCALSMAGLLKFKKPKPVNFIAAEEDTEFEPLDGLAGPIDPLSPVMFPHDHTDEL